MGPSFSLHKSAVSSDGSPHGGVELVLESEALEDNPDVKEDLLSPPLFK